MAVDEYQHPKREQMILRVCREILNMPVTEYEDIPKAFLYLFNYQEYKEIIRPLVDIERVQNGKTNGQICIMFDVPKGYVEYHFRNKHQDPTQYK